jgi:hypothetical protein
LADAFYESIPWMDACGGDVVVDGDGDAGSAVWGLSSVDGDSAGVDGAMS